MWSGAAVCVNKYIAQWLNGIYAAIERQVPNEAITVGALLLKRFMSNESYLE